MLIEELEEVSERSANVWSGAKLEQRPRSAAPVAPSETSARSPVLAEHSEQLSGPVQPAARRPGP